MLDVGCRMPGVGCPMLDVGCPMMGVGCPVLDVGCPVLDVGCLMLKKDRLDSVRGCFFMSKMKAIPSIYTPLETPAQTKPNSKWLKINFIFSNFEVLENNPRGIGSPKK